MVRYALNGLFLTLMLNACSASKVLLSRPESNRISVVAVLPNSAVVGIRPERAKLIRSAVVAELRNRGFLLLEDRIVNQICRDSICADRQRLFADYQADAAAELSLQSVSTNNFLLGYYDSIDGQLAFKGSDGRPLELVRHAERKQGGIFANTGQAITALKSQSDRFNDDSFEPLARNFARALIGKVSEPAAVDLSAKSAALNLGDVSVSQIPPAISKICVSGTPGGMVSVNFGGNSAYLNELKAGQYCTALSSLGLQTSEPWQVELRAATGLSVKKNFSYRPAVASCDLDGLVKIMRQGEVVNLALTCASPECAVRFVECQQATKIIYRAPTSAGPFMKVGEFKGSQWADRQSNQGGVYGLLLKRSFNPAAKLLLLPVDGKI